MLLTQIIRDEVGVEPVSRNIYRIRSRSKRTPRSHKIGNFGVTRLNKLHGADSEAEQFVEGIESGDNLFA